jgi:hypothetical protein
MVPGFVHAGDGRRRTSARHRVLIKPSEAGGGVHGCHGRAKGCQVALDCSLQRESMSRGGVEYKSVCNATNIEYVSPSRSLI